MSGYVGRFAPSPTGPLHFGSLIAALASYLDARHQNGKWLLRIEDLDPPRESAEAPDLITEQLKAHGLTWDGDILYQSHRLAAYASALDTLSGLGLTFKCDCSRRDVGAVYPGICRDRMDVESPYAIRLKVDNNLVTIKDQLKGELGWQLDTEVGDFIIKRKDGLFAYQLAVVVDDAYQDVTRIVRGDDLLDSTPRQLALIRALGFRRPGYTHIPVARGADGDKLSKQTGATPIDNRSASSNLLQALEFLGQPTPPNSGSVESILQFAVDHWQIQHANKNTAKPGPVR